MLVKSFAIAASLFCASAYAESRVDGAVVVSCGTYAGELVSRLPDANGTGQDSPRNIRQIGDCPTVQAKPGIRFGMEVEWHGTPIGGPIRLQSVITYPAGGVRSPTSGVVLHEATSEGWGRIGMKNFVGYRLDEPWERIPGRWTIKVLYEGKVYAEQSFELVTP